MIIISKVCGDIANGDHGLTFLLLFQHQVTSAFPEPSDHFLLNFELLFDHLFFLVEFNNFLLQHHYLSIEILVLLDFSSSISGSRFLVLTQPFRFLVIALKSHDMLMKE